MDLQWPQMVTAEAGTTHREVGRRLHWPDYHVSLAVPPTCSVEAGAEDCLITSQPEGCVALLSLHDASDFLVSNWLDEPFEDSEKLEPQDSVEQSMDVASRRFASGSRAGYKFRVDDGFRNGISPRLMGPASRAEDLANLLIQILDSVRFVHLDPLTKEQVLTAAVGMVNVDVEHGVDLFLYLDRHFYVMRNEVMEAFGLFAEQAEEEGHPAAAHSTARWELLQEARRRADAGEWTNTIAGLRAERK